MSQPENDPTTLDAATRAFLDRLNVALSLPCPSRHASPKPFDYRARRRWQDDARARGEIPECGREACPNPAEPAWTNMATPLLYCQKCAMAINRHNPGLCTPEISVGVPVVATPLARDVVLITREAVTQIGRGVAVGAPVIVVDVAPAPADAVTIDIKIPQIDPSALREEPPLNRAQARAARRGRR